MSSEAARTRSPFLAAVGISLTIAGGTVLGTLDVATVKDAITGQWLTRAFTETQQGHTVAIAALEGNLAAVTRDIDFVASRADASMRRNEEQAADRFAHLDAEIAALKDKIAGIQGTLLLSSRGEAPLGASSETVGLRSSLAELASAQHSAVAAITRRLDRIEVKVGLTTDVASSAASPVRKVRRVAARARKAPLVDDPFRSDRGHIFGIKPLAPASPLRLSRASS